MAGVAIKKKQDNPFSFPVSITRFLLFVCCLSVKWHNQLTTYATRIAAIDSVPSCS